MVVVMMMSDGDHRLRLRRIRCCEAEDVSECEQNPFHS